MARHGEFRLEQGKTGNHGHVRTGAADIERDQLVDPFHVAEMTAADDARDRSRHHRPDRRRSQHRGAAGAAIGFHHQGARARKSLNRKLLQIMQVSRDRRPDVGVCHGRRRALVFAPLRIDLVRKRNIEIRRDPADDLRRGLLMSGIGVGEQKAHRDRLDPVGNQLARGVGDIVGNQRLQHVAARIQSFADFVDAIARQQHLRRRRKNVEHLVAAPLPADLIDIAKPARRQQANANTLAFQHGVQRHRRAVHDQRHAVAECGAEVAQDVLHHDRRTARIGRIFQDGDKLAFALVKRDDIGERAADINSDAQCHEPAVSRRNCAVFV